MGKLGLVLDCSDPEMLAEFWSAALGWANLGGAGSYVALADPEGVAPALLLQKVPEPKSGKNRMHLDIHTPEIEDEATRLEGLGATRLDPEVKCEHGTNWVLMADPEGNEFCVCDGGI